MLVNYGKLTKTNEGHWKTRGLSFALLKAIKSVCTLKDSVYFCQATRSELGSQNLLFYLAILNGDNK